MCGKKSSKKSHSSISLAQPDLGPSNLTCLCWHESPKNCPPYPCCGKKCLPNSPSGRVEIQFQTCISIKENGINFPPFALFFPPLKPLFHRVLSKGKGNLWKYLPCCLSLPVGSFHLALKNQHDTSPQSRVVTYGRNALFICSLGSARHHTPASRRGLQ